MCNASRIVVSREAHSGLGVITLHVKMTKGGKKKVSQTGLYKGHFGTIKLTSFNMKLKGEKTIQKLL